MVCGFAAEVLFISRDSHGHVGAASGIAGKGGGLISQSLSRVSFLYPVSGSSLDGRVSRRSFSVDKALALSAVSKLTANPVARQDTYEYTLASTALSDPV